MHLPYPNKIHYLLTNQKRTKRQTQTEFVFTFEFYLLCGRRSALFIRVASLAPNDTRKISLLRTFSTHTMCNAYVQHARVLRVDLTRERSAAETSGDGVKVKKKTLVFGVPGTGSCGFHTDAMAAIPSSSIS